MTILESASVMHLSPRVGIPGYSGPDGTVPRQAFLPVGVNYFCGFTSCP